MDVSSSGYTSLGLGLRSHYMVGRDLWCLASTTVEDRSFNGLHYLLLVDMDILTTIRPMKGNKIRGVLFSDVDGNRFRH